MWVRDCGSEKVPIYVIREGTAGFSNLKSLLLELVDYVPRLAVRMCGYGVGEVGTGASEQVGGMVNGTSITQRPTAWLGAGGGGDWCNSELTEVERFAESDGSFVRRACVDGSKVRM